MKQLFAILFLTFTLSAKTITPNDVYTLSTLIQNHIHYLLKFYGVEHHHDAILKRNVIVSTKLKPRNTWQKTYEILVKINMQRAMHDLARIEPVGIEATLYLNPDMVYEMNVRILAELEILEVRNNISVPKFKRKVFKNKTPLDNYNIFIDISAAFDELNKRSLTPSYVFAESMRIYDDLTIILNYLNIKDNTMPNAVIKDATPKDTLYTAFKLIDKVQSLQSHVGIQTIDFSEFKRKDTIPSDVYTVVGFILAELQTIKAYIGLNNSITPSGHAYHRKKPENVEQLLAWNLKRLELIEKLSKGGR